MSIGLRIGPRSLRLGPSLGARVDGTVVIVPPVYKAASALILDAGSGKTVPWPAGHAANDIALLFASNTGFPANQEALTTAAGFTLIGNIVGGGPADIKASVWWCKATSGAMTSPVVASSGFGGSSSVAQMFTFTGANGTAPIDVHAESGAADNNLVATGATTTGANELVVILATQFSGGGTDSITGWANADLTTITEQVDNGVAMPSLGSQTQQMALTTGVKVAAGAYGDTTATWSGLGFNYWAAMTVALKM